MIDTPAQGWEFCPNTGTTFIGPKKWHRCNDCTHTDNSAKPFGRHQRPATVKPANELGQIAQELSVAFTSSDVYDDARPRQEKETAMPADTFQDHLNDPATCPECKCTRYTEYTAHAANGAPINPVYYCQTPICSRYAEVPCAHENTYIERKSPSPLADYWYVCEDCGAIGQPDGPADDEGSAESIDWDAS